MSRTPRIGLSELATCEELWCCASLSDPLVRLLLTRLLPERAVEGRLAADSGLLSPGSFPTSAYTLSPAAIRPHRLNYHFLGGGGEKGRESPGCLFTFCFFKKERFFLFHPLSFV
jgi:hypothetical protein